jgi:hypothetical protein
VFKLIKNLYKSSSPELACQFQSNLVQIILGYRESKIVHIKGQVLFKGEIIAKMGWGHLEIFLRTTKPEKLRLTQKLPDMVEIQVCTNHGPQGSVGAIMGKTIFTCVYTLEKILFSRSSNPISMKLGRNDP